MSKHPDRPYARSGDIVAVKWDDGYTYFQLVAFVGVHITTRDAGDNQDQLIKLSDVAAVIEADDLDKAAMVAAMVAAKERLGKAGLDVWLPEDLDTFYSDMVRLRDARLPAEYEKLELLASPKNIAIIERAFESAGQAKSYRSVAFWNPVKAELPGLAYDYLWACYCSLAKEVKNQPRLTEIIKTVNLWSQEENRGVQEWYDSHPIN